MSKLIAIWYLRILVLFGLIVFGFATYHLIHDVILRNPRALEIAKFMGIFLLGLAFVASVFWAVIIVNSPSR